MILESVRNQLNAALPADLVEALLTSYLEIKSSFWLRRYEPSELNGGKFAEVCIRILQKETSGTYAPLGTRIPNVIKVLRDFENVPARDANDSYRIHIPRTLVAIYNVRNNRGVGHVGGDVNPNVSDSMLLVSCADWVLADLLRIHYSIDLGEAQRIVDALVQRSLPLVYEVNGIKRVLHPSLTLADQTLALLAASHPSSSSVDELTDSIEPSNRSYYRTRVLPRLHARRLVELRPDGSVHLLPPGLRVVEHNHSQWMAELNGSEV